jgi:ABC-type multidrug transport system permease subunit
VNCISDGFEMIKLFQKGNNYFGFLNSDNFEANYTVIIDFQNNNFIIFIVISVFFVFIILFLTLLVIILYNKLHVKKKNSIEIEID